MSSLPLIQRLMVEQFELKLEDIKPDTQLESLGLDSLSVIEFMFDIEDRLKIRISDERVELKTVQDIVNFIDQLIATKNCLVQ